MAGYIARAAGGGRAMPGLFHKFHVMLIYDRVDAKVKGWNYYWKSIAAGHYALRIMSMRVVGVFQTEWQ